MVKYMITTAPPKIRWEMRGHPRGVVDKRIEAVAHVDEAAAAAKEEHDEGKPSREHHRTLPRQSRDPSEEAASATQTTGDLHRGRDGEDREKRRHCHKNRERHLHEFEPRRLLRVHEKMMHPDRQGVEQQQGE